MFLFVNNQIISVTFLDGKKVSLKKHDNVRIDFKFIF